MTFAVSGRVFVRSVCAVNIDCSSREGDGTYGHIRKGKCSAQIFCACIVERTPPEYSPR